ncbi:TetR/AcrR family transcriptional regulator [Arthrobacter sp. NicSoilB4]|uniref:TetR/AcrR family transcriptional regulator n=1 Tax=Arthrobacter sp. NicSoilB4 TaxID=2830997 RepID=UPI001CC7CDF4|nr:TetR/AcrR family transcriptional regulator [Arthrobacter sp. NicSoilB4]
MSLSASSGVSGPRPRGAADGGSAVPGVRDRILAAAYELFSTRGVRSVGVNELISRSGVAKASFYRHFASKDELVLAFLARRDQQWTLDKIVSEALRRGTKPEEQLLAIFDVFADWFAREDFEACSFVNVLLEMGPRHPLGKASIDYLAKIRGHVQHLAEQARLRDPEEFSRSCHILMKGSIVSAAEGDLAAAGRARQMAGWLIDHHRV